MSRILSKDTWRSREQRKGSGIISSAGLEWHPERLERRVLRDKTSIYFRSFEDYD